jgi:hypothetical protein
MRKFLNLLLNIGILVSLLSMPDLTKAQSATFAITNSLIPPMIGNIFAGNELRGYYLYYYEGRSESKTAIYKLKIIDQNFQILGETLIELKKYQYMLESTSDGATVILKYYHQREKTLEYQQYDLQANLISAATRQARSGKEHQFLSQFQSPVVYGSVYPISMIPVAERGFVDQSRTFTKKEGFWLDFYSGEEKPAWSYLSNPQSEKVITAAHLTTTDDLLLFHVSQSSGSKRSGASFSLLALQIEDGKKRFEIPLQDEQYLLMPTSAYHDPQKRLIHLLGQYYLAERGAKADESDGLFIVQIDEEGEILDEKYTSHTENLQPWLAKEELKRYQAMGNLYIHNIFPWQDGKVIAVGETYRKGLSALGVASGVIPNLYTTHSSLAELTVGDLVIFEFASDFSLIDIELIEKSTSHVALPSGSLWVNEDLLAHAIKQSGQFDYQHTIVVPEKDWFSIGYHDYERIRGGKNRLVFGQISRRANEDMVRSKVSMGYLTDFFKGLKTAYPASPGYLMIAEHKRSEKALHLELRSVEP